MNELATIARAIGALALILAGLAGATVMIRRHGIRLPGLGAAAGARRLETIERLAIDAKRQLILVRRDGAEHLILLTPEGVQEIGATRRGERPVERVERAAPAPATAGQWARVPARLLESWADAS